MKDPNYNLPDLPFDEHGKKQTNESSAPEKSFYGHGLKPSNKAVAPIVVKLSNPNSLAYGTFTIPLSVILDAIKDNRALVVYAVLSHNPIKHIIVTRFDSADELRKAYQRKVILPHSPNAPAYRVKESPAGYVLCELRRPVAEWASLAEFPDESTKSEILNRS